MWFPLFVNLKDKKVLVIGGGKVAFKKISKIMEYEADITVIARWARCSTAPARTPPARPAGTWRGSPRERASGGAG